MKDSPSFGAFCRELTAERSYPLFTTVELSVRCNLRCVHCYNFDREKPLDTQGELSNDEISKLIDDVAAEGCLVIGFTGGEALAHGGLVDFVKRARKNNMAVKIKSNATMMTPEKARALRAAGATDLDVSIYGARKKTHDAFTTVAGSFEKTWRGIQAAKTAGLKPSVTLVIHKANVDEIPAVVERARVLEIPCVLTWELTSRYDGTTDSKNHRIDLEQIEGLYKNMPDLFPVAMPNPNGNVQCGCARMVCGISSRGDVYPCIGAPIPAGNVRENSFSKIWNESFVLKKIRALELKDFKTCGDCGVRQYCQRSSGAIFTNTGNYTGPEEWTCDHAELLARLDKSASPTVI